MRLSETAAKYIGQRELTGNRFDDSTDFGKRIHAVGQVTGDSWCDLFVELVCRETFPEKDAELNKIFTKNANATYKNFEKAGYVTGHLPCVDWVVTWVQMKDGEMVKAAPGIYKGHTGIVSAVNMKDIYAFESIEGNTGDASGREGDIVAKKWHRVDPTVKNGLKVVGFIQVFGNTLKPF